MKNVLNESEMKILYVMVMKNDASLVSAMNNIVQQKSNKKVLSEDTYLLNLK